MFPDPLGSLAQSDHQTEPVISKDQEMYNLLCGDVQGDFLQPPIMSKDK